MSSTVSWGLFGLAPLVAVFCSEWLRDSHCNAAQQLGRQDVGGGAEGPLRHNLSGAGSQVVVGMGPDGLRKLRLDPVVVDDERGAPHIDDAAPVLAAR